jgi:hypothetical protein
MTLAEMAVDFCTRTGNRFTPEEVLTHGKNNISYCDEDGFFILSLGNNTLALDYIYVVPGRSKEVYSRYQKLMEEVLKESGARYFQTLARRPGIEKIYPPQLKPVAVLYEYDREADSSGRIVIDQSKPDDFDEEVDGR